MARMTICRDDEEIEIEVTGSYNPAQLGGLEDPSWDAYFDDIQVTSHDDIVLTDDEEAEASDALMDELRGDYDGY